MLFRGRRNRSIGLQWTSVVTAFVRGPTAGSAGSSIGTGTRSRRRGPLERSVSKRIDAAEGKAPVSLAERSKAIAKPAEKMEEIDDIDILLREIAYEAPFYACGTTFLFLLLSSLLLACLFPSSIEPIKETLYLTNSLPALHPSILADRWNGIEGEQSSRQQFIEKTLSLFKRRSRLKIRFRGSGSCC